MRLIWCTDIHLDHCKDRHLFVDDVLSFDPDCLCITGDISNASLIEEHLSFLSASFDMPVYFVLGNHDYYGPHPWYPAKINNTRKIVHNAVAKTKNLVWLEESGPVKLTDEAALVGHSLWCDWRAGLQDKSMVWLNDYLLISELFGMPNSASDRAKIRKKVRNLANKYTNQLMKDFVNAVDKGFKKIIIGTHVPPFHEASFYGGKVQDDNWAPHFVCKIAGDKLKEEVIKHSDIDVTVLCGHCFDEETELLTANGWKKRKDLKIGMEVTSWNKKTKKLELNPILEFADYDYFGQMCQIKGKAVDLFVTPGHGLVDVGRSMDQVNLFNAQDFCNKHEYTFLTSGIMNKPGIDLTDEEIRLIVWISADGSFENRKDYVRFHFKKSRKIKRLTDLLCNLNISFSLKKQSKGTTKISLNLSDTTIGHLFNSERQLPWIISMANHNQAKVILEEYKNTDGCGSKKENERWFQIFTAKEYEADLLQSIAVLSGMRCSKYRRLEKSGNYGFILTLFKKQSVRVNKNLYSESQYEGHVWCVTVRNGTLLVRRNGKTCITQNTHGEGKADILPNLHVINGGATYRHPSPQTPIIL